MMHDEQEEKPDWNKIARRGAYIAADRYERNPAAGLWQAICKAAWEVHGTAKMIERYLAGVGARVLAEQDEGESTDTYDHNGEYTDEQRMDWLESLYSSDDFGGITRYLGEHWHMRPLRDAIDADLRRNDAEESELTCDDCVHVEARDRAAKYGEGGMNWECKWCLVGGEEKWGPEYALCKVLHHKH